MRILKDYIEKMGIFERYELAYDGREAVKIALEMKPDLLITSIVLMYIDGIGVLYELKDKLKNTAFVVSSSINSDFAIKMAFDRGANIYFTKPIDFESFSSRITDLFEHGVDEEKKLLIDASAKNTLMADITKEIQKIGLSAGIKGFRYVRYAIYLMLQEEQNKASMMNYIYPTVAKKFNTTPACVERDIRHAIENAWIHGSMSYIDEVFGFTVDADKGKPTNSAFIATVAERIRLKL